MGDTDDEFQASQATPASQEEFFSKCIADNADAISKLSDTFKDALLQSNNRIAELINNLAPRQDDVALVRLGKLEKVYSYLVKSPKVKEFRASDGIDVRNWQTQFDSAVVSIASAGCGLDLQATPLTDIEYGKLLKAKIGHQVELEITQALASTNKTWSNASKRDIKEAMLDLYMRRELHICGSLCMYRSSIASLMSRLLALLNILFV